MSNGSKQRIQRLQELVTKGVVANSSDTLVVFPQGWSAKFPTSPDPDSLHTQSLGENLASYVRRFPEFRNMQVLANPLGWTTYEDVLNSYVMAALAGVRFARFVFITGYDHMPRLRMVVNDTLPLGCDAEFYEAEHDTDNPLHEWAGRWWYHFKLLWDDRAKHQPLPWWARIKT